MHPKGLLLFKTEREVNTSQLNSGIYLHYLSDGTLCSSYLLLLTVLSSHHFNSRPNQRTKPVDCKEAAMEVFGCLLAIKMVSDVYNFCFRIGFGSPVILSPSTFVLQVKRKQL